MNSNKATGFTLIEVLLAMAITAVLSLLAYSGLSSAINAAEAVERQSKQLADIQLTMSVLERDIRHAVSRPIIDGFGDQQGAFVSDELNEYRLMLTRLGWDNYTGSRRAEVQRVAYLYENNELWRESWQVLDRWSDDEQKQRVLLHKDIIDFQLLFLKPAVAGTRSTNTEFDWVDGWDDIKALPEAVEIVVEFEQFGKIKRVFEIVSYDRAGT
jgi:general secretion pathway protein J